MKVVCHKVASWDTDLRNQRDSSPKSLLKRLDPWQKPMWPPKVRLFFESDHAWTGNAPARQSGLPVVGGRSPRALGEFLKLSPERIVHLQLPGDLFSYVQAVRPACIDIDFLEDQNIRVHIL